MSTGWSTAVTPDELADWSQALEETIRLTNAEYGRIVTVDSEGGMVRLIYTNDDLD